MTPWWRTTLRAGSYMALWGSLAWLLWRAIVLLSPDQYPAVNVTRLTLLLAGCAGLGVLSQLKNRPRWEASLAVFLSALLVLTHIFRYYVLDYANGPPSFWVSFQETGLMNAPYAAFLSIWPILGWLVTARLRRRLE